MNYIYETKFKVRDYECDIQGIVNNSNYQHYMEHNRHEYFRSLGLDFVKLHNEGIDLVVHQAKIQYKRPLHGGEEFVCCLNVRKEGVKYVFYQDLFNLPERQLCCRGVFEHVVVINGKLAKSSFLDDIYANMNK